MQRHNISGSEVNTRHENVPGYGAMHGSGARLQKAPRRWLVPTLLVLILLLGFALVGVVLSGSI